jgi:hypothetical protein
VKNSSEAILCCLVHSAINNTVYVNNFPTLKVWTSWHSVHNIRLASSVFVCVWYQMIKANYIYIPSNREV